MGNIIGVRGMWLFVPTGEPITERRPHVHVARMGGDKRVNIKFWLGPDVVLADKHASYDERDEKLALKLVRNNWLECMQEWTEMYGLEG